MNDGPRNARSTYEPRLGDRSLFPDLEARAYLNHAAISPPSLPVRDAVREVLDDYARRGAAAFASWLEQRARLREVLARLLGARPEDFALVQNTTQGVLDIALCMPWHAGDRVLLFEGEFPANVTPWQRAAALFDLEVRFLPLAPFARAHAEGLAMLEAELARGARLVATSAVQFQTGLRMPLRAMAERCHAYGAELFVDGIQACGAVPIDVGAAGIDYLSAGGHKWLMGLEGAGFLYVRPERVARLEPRVAGWLSHEEGIGFLFEGPGHLRYDRPLRMRADFLELGAPSTVGYAALEASVELLLALGVERIFAHVSAYLDRLEPALVDRGFTSLRARDPAARSATLGVLPPEGVDIVRLHAGLTERGIACTIPDGVLRFAPHWPNDPPEVDVVLPALDASLASLR